MHLKAAVIVGVITNSRALAQLRRDSCANSSNVTLLEQSYEQETLGVPGEATREATLPYPLVVEPTEAFLGVKLAYLTREVLLSTR